MLGHRVEVSVGMQQAIIVLDAIGADDEIGRLADGSAFSLSRRKFPAAFIAISGVSIGTTVNSASRF